MSDFTKRQEPGSLAAVEPLTSKTADGKPYERSASVQTEIARVLTMHPAEWLQLAPDLQNETLVHLVGHSRDRDRDLMGQLMQVLGKRIHRLARSRLRGFNKTTAEELALNVETAIFGILLTRKPSLSSEFLEVAFAEDVIKRTLMAIRAYRRSTQGHRGEILPGATDDDGDEIERPIELAADGRRSPEAIALEAAELDKIRNTIKDPRQFDAVKLHFVDGIPIRSADPKELDLMRHLNVSEGQARYLLRAGKKAIRKFFGGAQ